MIHPLIEGGFQFNFPHAYIYIKGGGALTEEISNFSYNPGASFGIGFVW